MVRKQGSKNKNQEKLSYMLETGTVDGMRATKKAMGKQLNFQLRHYFEIAIQRSALYEEIKIALIQKSVQYEFVNWQRAVKYKYSFHPLSVKGSLVYIGGRFNIGSEVNHQIPSFPGLYLAKNKDTVLQEHLLQQSEKLECSLTSREMALMNSESETIVSVSGSLDKVFDLTNVNNLSGFIELTKDFKYSKEFLATARINGFSPPPLIKTKEKLIETLLYPNWRGLPSNFDIPSNSQIFGQLIYSAGIEGILYPSKFTGETCLVIFPRNFANTDSYIKLDDEVPHEQVPRKLDGNNWRISEMSEEEIKKEMERKSTVFISERVFDKEDV